MTVKTESRERIELDSNIKLDDLIISMNDIKKLTIQDRANQRKLMKKITQALIDEIIIQARRGTLHYWGSIIIDTLMTKNGIIVNEDNIQYIITQLEEYLPRGRLSRINNLGIEFSIKSHNPIIWHSSGLLITDEEIKRYVEYSRKEDAVSMDNCAQNVARKFKDILLEQATNGTMSIGTQPLVNVVFENNVSMYAINIFAEILSQYMPMKNTIMKRKNMRLVEITLETDL